MLKTQYESANQTIANLKKEIEKEKSINLTHQKKFQTQSAREKRLKKRIESLENLFKRYKKEGRIVITESDSLLGTDI